MPPEKQTPIGSGSRGSFDPAQPFRDLVGEGAHVETPELVEVGPQDPARGREEAGVGGVGVGTAHETKLEHVVCRHHARVARMELSVEAFLGERRAQGVDPVRHEQRRTRLPLGEEVPHGPVHGPRHAHHDAVPGHERERPVDGADARGVGSGKKAPRFSHVHVPNLIQGRIEEIDHALDGLLHPSEVYTAVPRLLPIIDRTLAAEIMSARAPRVA